MKKRIIDYVKAGYPGLYIVSHEESRVEGILREVAVELNQSPDCAEEGFKLHVWSCTDGLVNLTENAATGNRKEQVKVEPMEMLEAFYEAPQKSIFIVRDFHVFVEEKNPLIWRKIKDALAVGKANNKSLIILGCRYVLPAELEKELTVLNFELPDREHLKVVLHALLASSGSNIKSLNGDEAGILAAASGMTTGEAENAFALSIVERGKVCREVVYREKVSAVKKGGLLEVMESKLTLNDIGGLHVLKAWLVEKKDQFTDAAAAYGLEPPRGIMLVGQPGCGKTETARACGAVFDIPILRLDASRLFGSLVGQSEQNWRNVHATAKAMAPCIVFIDEIDGIGGTGSNNDSGVTDRVVKSILQDMEGDSEGIFYIGTANDIDKIKAPLLRRFEELFSVDLPTTEERAAIFAIQLNRVKRDPVKFDLPRIAESTEGFSGAEVKKIVKSALSRAFADGKREPTTEDLVAVIKEFTPLSKTMAEDIEKRRGRLAGVAKSASGPVAAAKVVAPVAQAPKGTRRISFTKPE